jgi:O-antigen/teichoic acid export membrane protein
MALGSCFFEQLTISSTQVFQAFERGSITALFNQLTSLGRAVVAVFMLVTIHHATAMQWAIASTVVSAIVAVAALILVTVQYGQPKIDLRLIVKRTGEGLEYAFAASTTSAYDDLDKVMLSHYGMNAANGIYAMAYRIIEMATSPIASVQLAAEPRLFKLGEANPEDAYHLGYRLLKHGLLLSAGTAALLFLSAPILPHFVGKEFSEGVSAVRWLCLIPIFRSIHYMTGSVLTAVGKQRYRTMNQAVVALFNFLVNLWLIPHFGWRGAAWSSLATDCLLSGMNAVMLRSVLVKIGQLAPAALP